MLSKILSLLRSGYKTPKELSQETGICTRQIYRYLKEGKKAGNIVKVLPGVYGLTDTLPPSFDEYISGSSSSNSIVWMSKKQQHNNTKQYLHKNDSSEHRAKEIQETNCEDETMSMTSKKSLRETTVLILSTAKLDYSEFELKLAMNKLRDVHWQLVDETNVEELVSEARERFKRAQQQYAASNSTIEYPIPYFFGILRRILISSLIKQKQESYRQFVMEYGSEQKAAGAEEMPTFVSEPACEDKQNDELGIVSEEWEPVKEALKSVAEEHSIRFISDVYFDQAIKYLANNGHYSDRVVIALKYQQENDPEGACYLLENIHSPSKVEEAVLKNWRRYKKKMKTQSSEKIEVKSKKTRDERYGAFYKLFPDA